MARYVPSALLRIEEPCGESWDAMAGNSRVRHCAACDRDVINAAALTPEQIEQHIAAALKGEPVPCMRLVQFEDGALLTARTERRLSLAQRAIAGVSALALAATSALVQGCSAKAIVRGQIVDTSGRGIPGVTVELWREFHHGITVRTETDGRFKAEAYPGSYDLIVSARDFYNQQPQVVVLREGEQQLPKPVVLRYAPVVMQGVWIATPSKLKGTVKPNSDSKP